MAKTKEQSKHRKVEKRTSQGGNTPKTSSMNKHKRRNFKFYRGQGK
jgi:hypothetical protein